jgi:hypothetical protein
MAFASKEDEKPSELFLALNNEVTWLHTIWELFTQLYVSGDENFKIMNETAPFFFFTLQTVLFNEMVMIWNRLTDPPSTSGQENASLERLIEQLDQESQSLLVASLQSRLERIRIDFKGIRTWRNKRVSHNDLDVTLSKEENSMPKITRGQLDAGIKEMADFMNEFSLELFGSNQKYVPFLVPRGDANALLQSLRIGLEKKND